MAELKTTANNTNVEEFINKVENPKRRSDSLIILDLMKKITKEKPVMWGTSIIGFGKYHYKSERSRQEGDWPLTGFSPRKQALTVYIMPGFKNYQKQLKKLGKFKTGSSCLYIKNIEDIDLDVLKSIVKDSLEQMKKIHKVN